MIDGVDLVVLENLSTRCRTGKENEGESWAPVQEWALGLRRRSISVLFIQAALTLREYSKSHAGLNLSALVKALTMQTVAITEGDLGRSEAMLAGAVYAPHILKTGPSDARHAQVGELWQIG
jgi:hypothetical protein